VRLAGRPAAQAAEHTRPTAPRPTERGAVRAAISALYALSVPAILDRARFEAAVARLAAPGFERTVSAAFGSTSGTADERTLEYVNRALGDTEVRQESSTTGEPGRRSTTVSSGFRPLAPAHVVREGAAGTALLLYGSLPPAWIRFRPWFRDRALSRAVRGRS
jgi:hypothetical protein